MNEYEIDNQDIYTERINLLKDEFLALKKSAARRDSRLKSDVCKRIHLLKRGYDKRLLAEAGEFYVAVMPDNRHNACLYMREDNLISYLPDYKSIETVMDDFLLVKTGSDHDLLFNNQGILISESRPMEFSKDKYCTVEGNLRVVRSKTHELIESGNHLGLLKNGLIIDKDSEQANTFSAFGRDIYVVSDIKEISSNSKTQKYASKDITQMRAYDENGNLLCKESTDMTVKLFAGAYMELYTYGTDSVYSSIDVIVGDRHTRCTQAKRIKDFNILYHGEDISHILKDNGQYIKSQSDIDAVSALGCYVDFLNVYSPTGEPMHNIPFGTEISFNPDGSF